MARRFEPARLSFENDRTQSDGQSLEAYAEDFGLKPDHDPYKEPATGGAPRLAPPLTLGASAAAEKPNILFLLADDLRPDTVAALGNPVIETPNLDRLVRSGQAFRNAIANNPVCVASRPEILTGTSSFRNGVFPGFWNRFNDKLVTWPQAMRGAGYRTVFAGKWHVPGKPIDHGFEEVATLFAEFSGQKYPMAMEHDSYGRRVTGARNWGFQTEAGEPLYPEEGVGLTPDTDRRIADAAIGAMLRSDDRPFFVHVSFTSPHDPLYWPTGLEDCYTPEGVELPANFLPEHPIDNGSLDNRDEQLLPTPRTEESVRREIAIYYAVVTALDRQVGRFLAALEEADELDNTYVIFTSDHGLAKGSHGLLGKGNMYQHSVGVPLLIAGPGIEGGAVHDSLVQLSDLYPTVCDLVGAEIPTTVESRSFGPVLRGESERGRDELYGYFFGFQRMVRDARHKLIVYPQSGNEQLFDLLEDPNELTNLAESVPHQAIKHALREKLSAWQKQVDDPLLAP